MIESYEDIQATLQVLGVPLVFATFTIYGMQDFEDLYEDNTQSNTQVQTLEFNFNISTKDSKTHSIAIGNIFTTTDDTYTYTYKVIREQLVFGSGWNKLPVNRMSKVAL